MLSRDGTGYISERQMGGIQRNPEISRSQHHHHMGCLGRGGEVLGMA